MEVTGSGTETHLSSHQSAASSSGGKPSISRNILACPSKPKSPEKKIQSWAETEDEGLGSTGRRRREDDDHQAQAPAEALMLGMQKAESSSSSSSSCGRERLKRHREEVSGKVMIPEIWGQENLLTDWIDYSSFDKLLAPNGIKSAREALVAEGRRATSRQRLRVQSSC